MIDWKWTEIDRLESQEQWMEVKSRLMNSWNQNRHDLKALVRLGFFCWYVLVEEGRLTSLDVEMVEFETILREVTLFGLEHFDEQEDFLWCFGYMISMFPYYFGDYDDWEQQGDRMLKRAYELSPEEPVYKYSYLASLPNSYGKNKTELEQVQAVLNDRFPGEGLLSTYFKSIWQDM